jgi:hypothetical protein
MSQATTLADTYLSFLRAMKAKALANELYRLSKAVHTIASKTDDTADAINVLANTAEAVKVVEDFAKAKVKRAEYICIKFLTRKRRHYPELEAMVVLTEAEAKEAVWFTEVTKANEVEIQQIETVIDTKVAEANETTKRTFEKYKDDLKAFTNAKKKIRA